MSLKVENLSKTYQKMFSRKPAFVAVKDVSFEIKTGEIYALLGPNGAGKSTTVKMIAGLIKPSSGRITYPAGTVSLHKTVSAILEGTRNVYWRLSPLENLYYFANLRGIRSSVVDKKAIPLLKELEIDAKKKNQSRHLSRGMLQKVALAAALITEPQVLLLDEPTLGLDVASSRKIKEKMLDLAKNQGKTILLTTHQMNLVDELADKVGIIQNGSLVREGTISELKEVFKAYIYIFKITGKFSLNKELQKKYQASITNQSSEFTEIEMDCKNKQGVYAAIAFFKMKKQEILSMHRVVEDLEEIFLKVLSE